MAGRKKGSRKRRKSAEQPRKKRKLSLKRAAKAVAKLLVKHLVTKPEDERAERIAYVERTLAKRFEKLKGK